MAYAMEWFDRRRRHPGPSSASRRCRSCAWSAGAPDLPDVRDRDASNPVSRSTCRSTIPIRGWPGWPGSCAAHVHAELRPRSCSGRGRLPVRARAVPRHRRTLGHVVHADVARRPSKRGAARSPRRSRTSTTAFVSLSELGVWDDIAQFRAQLVRLLWLHGDHAARVHRTRAGRPRSRSARPAATSRRRSRSRPPTSPATRVIWSRRITGSAMPKRSSPDSRSVGQFRALVASTPRLHRRRPRRS